MLRLYIKSNHIQQVNVTLYTLCSNTLNVNDILKSTYYHNIIYSENNYYCRYSRVEYSEYNNSNMCEAEEEPKFP